MQNEIVPIKIVEKLKKKRSKLIYSSTRISKHGRTQPLNKYIRIYILTKRHIFFLNNKSIQIKAKQPTSRIIRKGDTIQIVCFAS